MIFTYIHASWKRNPKISYCSRTHDEWRESLGYSGEFSIPFPFVDDTFAATCRGISAVGSSMHYAWTCPLPASLIPQIPRRDTARREGEREEGRVREPRDPNLMRINFHFHKRDRFLLQSLFLGSGRESVSRSDHDKSQRVSQRIRGWGWGRGRGWFSTKLQANNDTAWGPSQGTDPRSSSPYLAVSFTRKMRLNRLWKLLRKIELAKQRDKQINQGADP